MFHRSLDIEILTLVLCHHKEMVEVVFLKCNNHKSEAVDTSMANKDGLSRNMFSGVGSRKQ